MKDNKWEVKRINKDIKGALKFWSDILLLSDADEWSFNLNYADEDLLNALYIFNHVAQNIAIKKGYFTEENIEQKMMSFREGIKEGFGFDTIELTNKVLGKNERK